MDHYHKLKCDCGSDEFIEKTFLKWKEGSGLIKEPAGQKCARCNRNVLTATMIKDIQIRVMDEKINELQKEKENAAAAGNQVPLQKGKQAETRVQPER